MNVFSVSQMNLFLNFSDKCFESVFKAKPQPQPQPQSNKTEKLSVTQEMFLVIVSAELFMFLNWNGMSVK